MRNNPLTTPRTALGIVLAVATLSILILVVTRPDRVHGQEDNPPARPTGMTGTVKHDHVSLTWNDPDDSTITGYQILRRDTTEHQQGEFQILVDDTGLTAADYTDTGVEAGKIYVYRVKARNGQGLSPQSGNDEPSAVVVSFGQETYTTTEGLSVDTTLEVDRYRNLTVPFSPLTTATPPLSIVPAFQMTRPSGEVKPARQSPSSATGEAENGFWPGLPILAIQHGRPDIERRNPA